MTASFGAFDAFISNDDVHDLSGRLLADKLGVGSAWEALKTAVEAHQNGNPVNG